MHKSSFFAFLAVFLLILLGIKGFHLLQYRPWHADGHFRYLSAAIGTTENGYFRRHERTVRRRGGAPEVDLAIRRQLDADAAAASPAGYSDAPETGEIVRLLKLMRPEDASAVLARLPLAKAREVTERMLERPAL